MNLKECLMKRMIISMIVVLSIQLSYAQENSTETKEITTTLKVYKQEAKKKDLQGLTEVTYFHSNGEIAQTGFLKEGKPHGEWTQYDPKGLKIASGSYKNGKRQGKWLFWNYDTLDEVTFNDNKVERITKWNNTSVVSKN